MNAESSTEMRDGDRELLVEAAGDAAHEADRARTPRARMSAIATTGPETSSIALSVASLGSMPCSMWCITASTTTMASSTTMPIASTRPSSDSTLIEKPSSGKKMNAPTSDTGTVSSGISVARQFCRKTKTTRMTRNTASSSVWTISLMPSVTGSVVSSEIVYSMSSGKRSARSAIVALIWSATSRALVPGIWKTAMTRRRRRRCAGRWRCRASSRARCAPRPSGAPASRRDCCAR